MALYPAPDMRTGAISLWVAGAEEAERAARVVRELGHVVSVVAAGGDGADDPLRARRARCAGRSRRRPTSRSPTARRCSPRWRRARPGSGTTSTPPTRRSTRRRGGGSGRGVNELGRGDGAAIELIDRRRRASAAPRRAEIDVGNAGTLLRLLPGWLAGQPEGEWTLDGDESIRRRPVDRVAEPLRLMGAAIESRDGRLPPLRVRGRAAARDRVPAAGRPRPGEVVRAARGLLADGPTSVIEQRARPATTPSGCCAPPARGCAPRPPAPR